MSDLNDQEYLEKYNSNSFMETHTGRKFYPANPRLEDITIFDIAHALSLKCRYNGHTIGLYSVAEHCCVMALQARKEGLTPDTQLHFLLHDGNEAYLPDVPRPIKHFFPELIRMEKELDRLIRFWSGLGDKVPDVVKEWDSRIIKDERAHHMFQSGNEWQVDKMVELGVSFPDFTASQAETAFLQLFMILGKEVSGKSVMLGYEPGAFSKDYSSDSKDFVPPDIRIIDLIGNCALAANHETQKPYFIHSDFNFVPRG